MVEEVSMVNIMGSIVARKLLMGCMIVLLPSIALCYQQQYVSAGGAVQSNVKPQIFNNSPRPALPVLNGSRNPTPTNIYLTPQQAELQRAREHYQEAQSAQESKSAPQNLYQPRKQDQWQQLNNKVQQQIQPSVQPSPSQQQRQQQIERSAKTFAQPAGQNNSKPMPQYNRAQQQAWLQNCMRSVNKKAAVYAEKFCKCGWQRIASEKSLVNLLISTSPVEIDKANKMLGAIRQACVVAIETNRH